MMALNFGPDFFYGDGEGPYDLPDPTECPTSVCQALMSMDDKTFRECCEHVGINPDSDTVINDLIDVIQNAVYFNGGA